MQVKEGITVITLEIARTMVRSLEQDWAKANGRRSTK